MSNINQNLTLFTKYLKNNKNLLTPNKIKHVAAVKDSFFM